MNINALESLQLQINELKLKSDLTTIQKHKILSQYHLLKFQILTEIRDLQNIELDLNVCEQYLKDFNILK